MGQGRENAKAFLKDNPDVTEQIRAAIMAAHATASDAGPVKTAGEDADGVEEE
ncbi:MAG: hypothetical protein ABFD85_14390 [Phycisphaerae bacterium]